MVKFKWPLNRVAVLAPSGWMCEPMAIARGSVFCFLKGPGRVEAGNRALSGLGEFSSEDLGWYPRLSHSAPLGHFVPPFMNANWNEEGI